LTDASSAHACRCAVFAGTLKQKNYDDISIEEITEHAMGRATFYLHYKYEDLLLEEFSEMANEKGLFPSPIFCLVSDRITQRERTGKSCPSA
jgi:AcrR family transcriptional regulator